MQEVYFGGPDYPSGHLRDLLSEQINAVPSAGLIHWVSYYFRDRRLAHDLLNARARGVKVYVTLEGCPRTGHANEAVSALLKKGLDEEELRLLLHPSCLSNGHSSGRSYLHTKMYYFSHPQPRVFLGSFNPSGDRPEMDPEAIREIGDHDIGHNALVVLTDTRLNTAILEHAQWLHQSGHRYAERFSSMANRTLRNRDFAIYTWPRVRPHPLRELLQNCARGDRIRLAVSHIKHNAMLHLLCAIARRGVSVEILAEPTYRRVSLQVEREIHRAGISFRRILHHSSAPMHNKFALIERGARRLLFFGSWNWTRRSLWLNHELGVVCYKPEIFEAFESRYETIKTLNPWCQ